MGVVTAHNTPALGGMRLQFQYWTWRGVPRMETCISTQTHTISATWYAHRNTQQGTYAHRNIPSQQHGMHTETHNKVHMHTETHNKATSSTQHAHRNMPLALTHHSTHLRTSPRPNADICRTSESRGTRWISGVEYSLNSS